ncbi:MAG TPA: FAD-dependent monooxygenase [Candidatus Methylomirabilis sp.]|nr:FAD-dependent monooxygenase [Candidatus Methylomirabilis sp.]
MSASSEPRVLVVGAGPVGLFLAIELARRGVPFRIIDQAAQGCANARASVLQSRTLEVLEAVGLVDRFLQAGVTVHGTGTYVHGNQRIKHVSMDELDSPFPFLLCLGQRQTEELLTEQLARLGRQVERGVKLLSFQQDETGVVAQLDRAGVVEDQRVDYLIGCDGGHSTVRHQLGSPLQGHDYPTDFVVADVRIDWTLPGDETGFFVTPERSLFVGPLPGGRSLVVSDLGPAEGEAARPGEPSLDELQSIMTACGPPGAIVRDPSWKAFFRCHARIVPRYAEGRVALAGDAAHVQSPVGGQGLNTGLQDAFNLAWKLALVLDGIAHPELLDSYHVERHATGRLMLGLSDTLHQNVFLHHPGLTESIRRTLMGYLASLEVMQQRLQRTIAELSVSYRHSPAVAEHRAPAMPLRRRSSDGSSGLHGWHDFGGAPRAGDRAPDARLQRWPERDPVRLFQVMAGLPHHLLLLSGVETAADADPHLLATAVQVCLEYGRMVRVHLITRQPPAEPWPGNGLVFLDELGEAHHRYGARQSCLYLIRPDGYIGFRSQPAEPRRVVKFLKGIFVRDRAAWATEHIARLKRGETVQFRTWGTSMRGVIEPGQLCTVAPVSGAAVKVGDAVLCKVKGKQCLHLVREVAAGRFLIGDNHGTINGWIGAGSLYGKCTAVSSAPSAD